jgi:uncharacterized protein (DUF2384 family)
LLGEAWDLEQQEREKIAAAERVEQRRLDAEARRIANEERRLQEADEKRRAAAISRDELQVRAVQAFRSADHADLWMRTTHPKLGFKRPTEVCCTPDGLTRCVAILQAEGKRRGRPAAYFTWKEAAE